MKRHGIFFWKNYAGESHLKKKDYAAHARLIRAQMEFRIAESVKHRKREKILETLKPKTFKFYTEKTFERDPEKN